MSLTSGHVESGRGQVTRRRFLRATAAATLLASGVWSQTAPARSRSPNSKLNIAAIGVANRGETNLLSVASENIVALCDVDQSFLDEREERFPSAKQYRDFREMLQRDDLDAVVVSSPDHTHALASLLALKRGLHVYCEKPLAHSVAEVRAMADAAAVAKADGRVTQTGVQHHSTPGYYLAVEWVRSGVLGEVREVHAWTDRPFWPQAIKRPAGKHAAPRNLDWNLWLGPAPERPYAPGYHPLNWRGFWDFGTGALGDRGPHLLDPVFTALNLGWPTRVDAVSKGANDETGPESSVVSLEFDRLKLTWYDGDKQPAPELAGVRTLPANGALLIGSEAKLFIPELGGRPTLIMPKDKPRPAEPKLERPPPESHYAEWLAACRGEGAVSCDFAYGAKLTGACLLGNIAIRAGRGFSWDAARGSIAGANGNAVANGNADGSVGQKPGEQVGEHPGAKFLARKPRKGWEV